MSNMENITRYVFDKIYTRTHIKPIVSLNGNYLSVSWSHYELDIEYRHRQYSIGIEDGRIDERFDYNAFTVMDVYAVIDVVLNALYPRVLY